MDGDTSGIPAGYLTTFSLAKPNGFTPRKSSRARRSRRVFVCIPCYHKKTKCNKLTPCSRCLAIGKPDKCLYFPLPTANGNDTKSDLSPAATVASPCSSSSLDPSSLRSTLWSKTTTDGTSLGSNEEYEWEGASQPLIRPLNGATHWARIACGFEEAVPYLFGTECHWQQRYRQVKNLECLFANPGSPSSPSSPSGSPSGSTNFPFSSSSISKCQVLRSFPPFHIIDTLVANYMKTFGATHCLFHASQLGCDVQTSMSDEWLAQFFMVLALGAEAAPDYLLFGSLGQSAAELADMFLRAAEASFSRSSYMAAPSLLTVRTLCMMVIAKLVEMPGSGGSTGGSTGGSGAHSPLVSLMAFTVQTAKTLQLHRSASAAPHRTARAGSLSVEEQHDSLEAEMRRRVWVTVRLLDLETSLRSGTTMHSEAGDAEPPQGYTATGSPCNSSDIFSINCMHGSVYQDIGCFDSRLFSSSPDDSLYQNKLSSCLPLLASITNTVNSPTEPSPAPEQVAAWAADIRKHLGDIDSLVVVHGKDDTRTRTRARTASQIHQSTMQLQHLKTVAHRVLLASQHDLFCDSLMSLLHPPSPEAHMARSAVIESALTLLNTQKSWAMSAAGAGVCGHTDVATADTSFSLLQALQPGVSFPGVPGPSSPVATAPAVHATAWLLDLCHDDFAAALMYMVLALRATHFKHFQGQDHDESDMSGLQSAGEEAAATAVRGGYEIMRDRSSRSVGHFHEFFGMAIVFACFRGLESGDMLSQVVEATNDVEQVVVAGRLDLLWAAGSDAPDDGLLIV